MAVMDIKQTRELLNTGKRIFSTKKSINEVKEIVFYRGVQGNLTPDQIVSARPGYSLFGSSNYYVAQSYEQGAGKVYRLKAYADKIIEYPTRKSHDGRGNEFSKFGFDDWARGLKHGEVLVARNVYDSNPSMPHDFAKEHDPNQLATYPSDIYAVGKGTKIEIIE